MATSEKQKLAQELDKATKLKTYLVSDDPAVEALVEKSQQQLMSAIAGTSLR